MEEAIKNILGEVIKNYSVNKRLFKIKKTDYVVDGNSNDDITYKITVYSTVDPKNKTEVVIQEDTDIDECIDYIIEFIDSLYV